MSVIQCTMLRNIVCILEYLNHNKRLKWFNEWHLYWENLKCVEMVVRSMINCYPLKSASSSTKQNSASAAVHVYTLRPPESASWHFRKELEVIILNMSVCVREIIFLSIIQTLCGVQNKLKWVIYKEYLLLSINPCFKALVIANIFLADLSTVVAKLLVAFLAKDDVRWLNYLCTLMGLMEKKFKFAKQMA